MQFLCRKFVFFYSQDVESFAKDRLSGCKRPCFTCQKTVFCKAKHRSLRLETYLFQMRDERREMMVFPQIADIHAVAKCRKKREKMGICTDKFQNCTKMSHLNC